MLRTLLILLLRTLEQYVHEGNEDEATMSSWDEDEASSLGKEVKYDEVGDEAEGSLMAGERGER